MKVLIIGGTGILSTAVVSGCIDRGDSVTMINRGNRPNQINPKASLIKCDVRNISELEKAADGLRENLFDVVVDFLVFSVSELEVSLRFFSKITKQYVFISSAQVYNTSIKGTLKEDSPKPQPLWSYSVNKLKCETFLEDYCKANNINYTIIRPAVNYDGSRIPYGIYPPMGYHWTIVERIKHGKPIITWNNGKNRLNLTRVEDFAKATVGLLGNQLAYNEAFNVAGHNVYSWGDVLNVVGKIIGKEVITFDVPVDYYVSELPKNQKEELAGGRSKDMVCSIDKLKSVLPDFRAQYDLYDGINLTLQYYQSNNYLSGIDYGFDGDCDRIIKKYCKLTGEKEPDNCHFIDYFGNANKRDRKAYNNSIHKDVLYIRLSNKIRIFLSLIKSKVLRFIHL